MVSPSAYLCYPTSIQYLSPRSNINITKLYIGYLPVSMNDAALREVFQRHCSVSEVIIKKGNAQGHFDKFCYGFVTMNMPENQAKPIIAKINDENPNWKIKIKEDGHQNHSRGDKYQRQSQGQPQHYQGQQPNMYQGQGNGQMPPQMMHMHQMQYHQPQHQHQGHHNQSHQPQHHHQQQQQQQGGQSGYPPRQQQSNSYQYQQQEKGQIYGQKHHRIMVRELWMGGIPEMIDHNYMTNVMSEFGLVQATQIFPKFAFVKFKRAIDAAVAYQRASRIFQIFGKNSGFRIAFSDPSRRKQIVSNHYDFEKNAALLPILFLGFPPITSANLDISHMMGICQKFGTITSYYLNKSTKPQMRSYILFTYDNIKNALRAKQELCRRKDLLGDKRVQITLLLDEESITKGRDFSNTQKNFAYEEADDKAKKPQTKPSYGQGQQGYGNFPAPGMVPGNYPMMPTHAGMMGQHYGYPPGQFPPPNFSVHPPPNYGYFQPPQFAQQDQKQPAGKENSDVLDILQSVYEDPAEEKKKGPKKKGNQKQENPSDIIKAMLNKDDTKKSEEDEGQIHQNQHVHEKQPDWSGFITWRGGRRAGVDGFSIGDLDFSDFSININSLIANEDVLTKQKLNMMVMEPTNSISQPTFNEYVKIFKKRTGISMTKNWLIYVIGKNELSDSLTSIKDNQMLMVMQKLSMASQIKQKVIQCSDSYFE